MRVKAPVFCSKQVFLLVGMLVVHRVGCTEMELKRSGFPSDARVRIIGGRETRIADLEPQEFVEYVDDAGMYRNSNWTNGYNGALTT